MRSKKITYSVFIAFLTLFMLVAAIIFPISAVAKNCTLTLVCSNNSKPVANLEWSIYRIGSRNPYGGFVLEGDFAKYPVALDDMSASSVQKAAYTLENYAKIDGIHADGKGTSDSQGRITLTNLESGIYLISGNEYSTSKFRYTPSPSIIELGGDKGTNVTVYPKFTVEDIPDPSKTSYSVKKVWANDEGASAARPKEISVELYANEKLYKTIKLNASNGWHYEWKSDSTVSWRVKESTVAKNYTVNVGKNGTEFLVVNTYNPPKKTTSSVTTTTTTTTTTKKKITTTPSKVVTTTTTLSPRDELVKRIKEYDDFNEDDYTPDSWKEFKDALERARRTLSYTDATDEEIKTALEELEEARRKLVLSYVPQLPQTGQLWWPVPILAGGGLVLIAVGIRLIIKKGSKDEKE